MKLDDIPAHRPPIDRAENRTAFPHTDPSVLSSGKTGPSGTIDSTSIYVITAIRWDVLLCRIGAR